MNDIRKNTEQETEIVSAKFKIPVIFKVFFIMETIYCLLCLSLVFILFSDGGCFKSGGFESGFALTCLLIVWIVLLFNIIGIKRSICIVTNKRIYGTIKIVIITKKFSYRLDEVDNVEVTSTLGVQALVLNFSQGHGPQGTITYKRGTATVRGAGTFRIGCLANADEMYNKLSELIVSVKNDKDLMVDIEMEKIGTEDRKAAAFEQIANNIGEKSSHSATQSNSDDYIKELKGLKELLDDGIITKEEFEARKKKLLSRE